MVNTAVDMKLVEKNYH